MILAKNYEPPKILFDYALRDTTGDFKLGGGEQGTLYIVLKNAGGNARNVHVSVKLPSYVKVLGGSTEVTLPQLPSGEEKKVAISVIVPDEYARIHKEIPIDVRVKAQDFSGGKTFTLALGEYVQPPEEVVLKPKVERREVAYVGVTDVDRRVKELKPAGKRQDAVALVIGIGSYKNLPPSRYSEYDAILMRNVFKNVYGIETETLINENADYTAIKDAVERLAADVKGKEVYVYYSGHGFPKNDAPAIVPYNIPRSFRQEYLISLPWMVEEFKKGGARRVVVLVDACYSGFDKEGKVLVAEARPVYIVLENAVVGDVYAGATDNKGKSYSDKKLRHGIFTYYLAKALLEGDRNGDGAIDKLEFEEYLREARRHARRLGFSDQRPVFEARSGEEVVIRK